MEGEEAVFHKPWIVSCLRPFTFLNREPHYILDFKTHKSLVMPQVENLLKICKIFRCIYVYDKTNIIKDFCFKNTFIV